jgi:hypothetical protein
LDDKTVRVVIRTADTEDITSKGRVLFGEAHFGSPSAEETQRQRTVEAVVRRELQSLPNTFVTSIDAVHREAGWAVRTEVVGPRVPATNEVRDIEERSAKVVGEPVSLLAAARTEILVTGTRYQTIGEAPVSEDNGATLPTPSPPAP